MREIPSIPGTLEIVSTEDFTLVMRSSTTRELETEVFEKLGRSDVYDGFREAFRNATDLPLRFMRWDMDWCLSEHRENQSPFCEILNPGGSACRACVETNRQLVAEVKQSDRSATRTCFTGLRASAVPVKLGKTTIGYLKTGQVFSKTPKESDFEKLERDFSDKELQTNLPLLREAYFQTRTITPKRYESMITLLGMFADQLSAHAEKIAMSVEDQQPEGISRAREAIHEALGDPILLDDLAKIAGMSKSHFCRVFKETTNMTVTEYVTRARIGRARTELLRSGSRISEVAYSVGFQSLSQFNRSFVKLVGKSPSEYKKGELASRNISMDSV